MVSSYFSSLILNVTGKFERNQSRLMAFASHKNVYTVIVYVQQRALGLSNQGLNSFSVLRTEEWDCTASKYS